MRPANSSRPWPTLAPALGIVLFAALGLVVDTPWLRGRFAGAIFGLAVTAGIGLAFTRRQTAEADATRLDRIDPFPPARS